MKHLAGKECRSKVVEDVEEKCDTLVDTFTVHLRNKYNRYFFAFLGCEMLNIVMVVTQVENYPITVGFVCRWNIFRLNPPFL